VGTVNVGSRAPTCPPFIVALRERGHTAIHDSRPRSERGSNQFSDPEITFLTLCYPAGHQLSNICSSHKLSYCSSFSAKDRMGEQTKRHHLYAAVFFQLSR
jgi:hypothetical protein